MEHKLKNVIKKGDSMRQKIELVTFKDVLNFTEAVSQIDEEVTLIGKDENGKTYVFEDTDTLFRGKFNSSDVYGALKEGKTYELTVIGFRVYIFNWYENIIDFKAVK